MTPRTPPAAPRCDRTRRRLLGAAAASLAAAPAHAEPVADARLRRPIPSTGELVPAIGVGTWLTFNAPDGRPLAPVLQRFFDGGGTLIDSSPMYGRAETVIGELLARTARREPAFTATKIWTPGRALGVAQLERSLRLWGVERLDLVQVHNLVDWPTHLATLREQRRAHRVRYIGLTTSHGRRHDETERALTSERVDVAQFTYSLADRSAEQRLLPLCAERGIAVIANRPFDGGDLFNVVRGRPLPAWARELDAANWAQFFLKFIVSHPAVTCAIPATSNPDHMSENIGALRGRLPDAELRRRMVRTIESL